MLLYIAIALVCLVAVIVGYATTRPDTFHVQREVSIKAAPSQILPLIESFHKWSLWSPYENLDPKMTRSYSGAEQGKGAVYEWSGNAKSGTGRMEILEVVPDAKVTIQLTFTKPMPAQNVATFTLTPQGETTTVSWAMDGPASLFHKVFSVLMNMDKLVGSAFEQGLRAMKATAEQ